MALRPVAPAAEELPARDGKRVIAYWHMRGAGTLCVDLGEGPRTYPADRLRYLETPLTREALKAAWSQAGR